MLAYLVWQALSLTSSTLCTLMHSETRGRYEVVADIVELLATVTPMGLDFIGEGGVRRTEGMGAGGGGKGREQLVEGG